MKKRQKEKAVAKEKKKQENLYYKNRKGLDYICQVKKCEIFETISKPY